MPSGNAGYSFHATRDDEDNYIYTHSSNVNSGYSYVNIYRFDTSVYGGWTDLGTVGAATALFNLGLLPTNFQI